MTTYAPYAPRVFFLRDNPDRERLLFHIKSGDYFGTLATILALAIDLSPSLEQHVRAALEGSRLDLVYLQDKYRIVPKTPDRYTR